MSETREDKYAHRQDRDGPPHDSFRASVVPVTQPTPQSAEEEEKLKLVHFCRRPGQVTVGTPARMSVNFVKITSFFTGNIFQYHLEIEGQGKEGEPEELATEISRKRKRQIVNEVEKQLEAFLQGTRMIYDGDRIIFSMKSLSPMKEVISIRVPIETRGGPAIYYARLKETASVDISQLERFRHDTGSGNPAIVSQVFDIAVRDMTIRGHEYSSLDDLLNISSDDLIHFREDLKQIRRSVFRSQGARHLASCIELWTGFHMNARALQGGLLLNVDTSYAAFYKAADSLLTWITDLLGLRNPADIERLTRNDIMKVNKSIKGLRVGVNHRKSFKKFIAKALSVQTAENCSFEDKEGRQLTVNSYFRDRYNFPLRFPRAPLVEVSAPRGSPSSGPIFLPLEACNVPSGQQYPRKLDSNMTSIMVRECSQKPSEKQRVISMEMEKLAKNEDLRKFDIAIDSRLMQVNARVLAPPSVKYRNRDAQADMRTGSWNLRDLVFADESVLENWGVIILGDGAKHGEVNRALESLVRQCGVQGMTCRPPSDIRPVPGDYMAYIKRAMQDSYTKIQHEAGNPKLLVVILPEKEVASYGEVKRVGDTVLGVPTQCLVWPKFCRANPQYTANVALKIHSKLNGINSRVQVFDDKRRDVLVVGADINHPAGFDRTRPTLTSLVGAVDDDASLYVGRVTSQQNRCQAILNMKDMMKDLLISFHDYRSFHGDEVDKPRHILIYRDGIGEGQFENVYRQEIISIRKACAEIDEEYRPKLTYIVVQKRTHAKFFPQSETGSDKNGNAAPGTVIDSVIVHPWQFDFWLCSHASIQANTTTKPCHYFVLLDEYGYTPDQIVNITYRLCFKYARCTRSVSYPAPTYYAHIMSQRARFYDERFMESDAESNISGETGRGAGQGTYTALHEGLYRKMFFV